MTSRVLGPAIAAITSTAARTAAIAAFILLLYTAPGASGDQPATPLTISGPQAVAHPEGTSLVAQYSTNAAADQTIAWSLEGDDGASFTITEGNLAFSTAPDYENPSDHGEDNIYQATLVATAIGTQTYTATFAVTVTVQNVNEPPIAASQTNNMPVVPGATTRADLNDIFKDSEGDALSFTMTAPRDPDLNASLDGSQLTLTASGEKRMAHISLTASDGQNSTTLRIDLQVTTEQIPPTPPTNLQAQPTLDGFILTWDPPTNSGSSEIYVYVIYYFLPGEVQSDHELQHPPSTTYQLTGLEPNTTYQILVTACNRQRIFSTSYSFACSPADFAEATTLGTNQAPTVTSPVQDWHFNPNDEAAAINLSTVFEDPDNDTLTYQAYSSDTTVATATITGSTLTLAPVDLGTATITVTAKDRADTDAAQLTASDTFTATVDYLPAITITAQHAERTEGQEIRFTLTADPAPSQSTEVKICVSQGNADYLTDGTPSSECDIAGPVDHTTNRVLAKIGFSAGSTSEELILQTEDDAAAEADATITAAVLRNPGDPYTAGNPPAGTTTVTDNDSDTPTLSAEPRPLRRVRISWNAIPGVEGYQLENQQEGQAWVSPTVIPYSANETHADLDLDRIDGSQGLGDADYDLRIRGFWFVSGSPQYTPYSQTIRLVDNPLLMTGGRAYSPRDSDDVEIRWAHIPDVKDNRFTTVIRKLDGTGKSINWPDDSNWPGYKDPEEPVTVTQNNSGSLKELVNLEPSEIYALQVNYTTASSPPVQVFSARDAYVWPSDKLPLTTGLLGGAPRRIATYPYFGHHASRTFNYVICDGEFGLSDVKPSPSTPSPQTEWENLVNGAFEAWKSALGGWITTNHLSGTSCTNTNMASYIQTDDAKNEIRLFEFDNTKKNIFDFNEFISDPFKICIDDAQTLACVTSFSGYAGLDIEKVTTRDEIAPLVEAAVTATDPGLQDLWGAPGEFLLIIREIQKLHTIKADNTLTGVDISFKKDFIETRQADPTTTGLAIPSTRFGQCLSATGNPVTDAKFGPYILALHEAGHALGISGFDYGELIHDQDQGPLAAHPTIPDSALNYDEDLKYQAQLVKALLASKPPGTQFTEHDCAPHPFDVMALYALYQNVPK